MRMANGVAAAGALGVAAFFLGVACKSSLDRGLPAGALVHAARQLPLTATQMDEIDAMTAELEKSQSELLGALGEFEDEIVGGVKAGRLDGSHVRADEAAIDAALRAQRAIEADVLDGLHKTLDAGQRKSVADWVRATRPPYLEGPVGSEPGWSTPPLERLTRELALDVHQRAQVAELLTKEAGMAPPGSRQRPVGGLLTAFARDEFDAHNALGPPARGNLGDVVRARVALLSRLLPLLRPDQRRLLVGLIERMATKGRTTADEALPALL
jgi:hypothetical protein